MFGFRRFSVRNTVVFSWARPMNSTPSGSSNSARNSLATSSLRCPSAESRAIAMVGSEAVQTGDECLADLAPAARQGADDGPR